MSRTPDIPRMRAFLDEMTSYLTLSQVDLRALDMDVRLADLIERLGDHVANLPQPQTPWSMSPREPSIARRRRARNMGLRLTIPPRELVPIVSDPTSEIEYLNHRISTLATQMEYLNIYTQSQATRPRAVSLPPALVHIPLDPPPPAIPRRLSNMGRLDEPSHAVNGTFAAALQARIRQMSAEANQAMHAQNAVIEEMNTFQNIIANPVILPPNTPPSANRVQYSNGQLRSMQDARLLSAPAQSVSAAAARYSDDSAEFGHHDVHVQDFAIASRMPDPFVATPRTHRSRTRPRVRREVQPHDPNKCSYVCRWPDGTGITLAVFDWSCMVYHRRLESIEDAGQALRGIMKLYVENSALIGPSGLDKLVESEIHRALDEWILSTEEADEFWSA